MGSALKVSMETTFDMSAITRDNWDTVFKSLRVQGFQKIYIKDKYLLVKSQFITKVEIPVDLLGGLLNIELYKKTNTLSAIFEVKKGRTGSLKIITF